MTLLMAEDRNNFSENYEFSNRNGMMLYPVCSKDIIPERIHCFLKNSDDNVIDCV